jgi:hypothetical protein
MGHQRGDLLVVREAQYAEREAGGEARGEVAAQADVRGAARPATTSSSKVRALNALNSRAWPFSPRLSM